MNLRRYALEWGHSASENPGGLTAQLALAKFSGVSKATVSRWFSGKVQIPYESLDDVARFFGVPVAKLFTDPNDPDSTEIDHAMAYRILGTLIPKKDG